MTLIPNFIDDTWPMPEATLQNISPARGEYMGTLPLSGSEEINLAVQAALRAHGPWQDLSTQDRATYLHAIADGIEKRIDEFAQAESEDTGKPLSLSRSIDIPRAIANFRFFAGALLHDETQCHPMSDAINYTVRRSLGCVGLITPWNLPLYLLTWKLAPALAMGNTVVAKPSELTPLTAHLLTLVCHDIGLPRGVFNVVHGLGHQAGASLVEHPDVKAISFTGGTQTGKAVAASAAPQFKKLSLELGGKNPSIVFADADFDKALDGVMRAAFTNQGQICLCGSRIFVEESLYQEFLDALVKKAKRLLPRDPSLAESKFGALISEGHLNKVLQCIGRAKEDGATIHCGGQRVRLPHPCEDGYYIAPTVLSDLAANSHTATEEIFGPVVSVHPFKDETSLLAMANGVRYGLSASLWTQDLNRAHRVAHHLDTGMVWVNTWLKRDLRVPFGGIKDSGVGREGGRYSIEFFSEARNICIGLES
jgi:aminomuconate-semialdehyde/2-hydroxymuconate-6-semialdehyde dehydrogenase